MPSVLPQTRLRWVQAQQHEILFLDFSHARPEESLALIEDFRQALAGRADGSVCLLTDLTDADYEAAIATRWKAARLQNASKIRASAIYGLSGLVGMAVRGLVDTAHLLGLPFGEKRLRIFSSHAEAMDWLVRQ